MENCELLEWAAKAIGGRRISVSQFGDLYEFAESRAFWNPLNDDGDAFQLALKLQIKIEYEPEMDSVMCSLPGSQGATSVGAIGDVELRYAIVQAAAQLGLTL